MKLTVCIPMYNENRVIAATAKIAEKVNNELGDKWSANTAKSRRINMNLNEYKEKVVEIVIEPMISFMEDWDDED